MFINSMAILVIIAMAVAAATGYWRLLFAPFRIPTAKMTVAKLELQVSDPRDVARINGVLANFAAGFNRMITARSEVDWRNYLDSLPDIFKPFAHEGAAMGYELRRVFGLLRLPPRIGFEAARFERDIVRAEPGMRYLYYVGVGFWAGMMNESAAKVQRRAERLDPLHRYLLFDGYGFKVAFFDYPSDPAALKGLHQFTGYARRAAFQGAGRALYFRHMDSPETLIERVQDLGEYAVDAASGLGLASVFVNPDRLDKSQNLGRRLPAAWQPDFHLGMCFALKARIINDPSLFDQFTEKLTPDVRNAVLSAIRECDRVELHIRSESTTDGYREWRKRVTAWLSDHVAFPMARICSTPKPTGDSSTDRAIDEKNFKLTEHAEVSNHD